MTANNSGRRGFLGRLLGAVGAGGAVAAADAATGAMVARADRDTLQLGTPATAHLKLWLQLDEHGLARQFARAKRGEVVWDIARRGEISHGMTPNWLWRLASDGEERDSANFGVFAGVQGADIVRAALEQIGWRCPRPHWDRNCEHLSDTERSQRWQAEGQADSECERVVLRQLLDAEPRTARLRAAHARAADYCCRSMWVPPYMAERNTTSSADRTPWNKGNFSLNWIIDTERLCMTPAEILAHLAALPGLVHCELAVTPDHTTPAVTLTREVDDSELAATSLQVPAYGRDDAGRRQIRPELSGLSLPHTRTNTADRFQAKLATAIGRPTATPALEITNT